MLRAKLSRQLSSEATVSEWWSYWRLWRGAGYARCWARRCRWCDWQTNRQVQSNEMFMWTDNTHEVELEWQQASDVFSDSTAVRLNVTNDLLTTHQHTHSRLLVLLWHFYITTKQCVNSALDPLQTSALCNNMLWPSSTIQVILGVIKLIQSTHTVHSCKT